MTWLLVVGTLISANAQQANTVDDRAGGFACQGTNVDAQQRAQLAQQISYLTGLVNNLNAERRAKVDSPPATPTEEQEALEREDRLREAQGKLTVALAQEDCLTSLELPSEKTRGPAEPPPKYVEIPIYYLTDRDTTGLPDAKSHYNAEFRKDGIEGGSISVVLASKLQFDNPPRARPKSWRDAGRPVDNVDFEVNPPLPIGGRGSGQLLTSLLKDSTAKKLLLFVHGFNVSYVEAVVRAVQLAHDIEFDGDIIVYSWPSVGSVLSYGHDEDSERISQHHLKEILQELEAVRKYDAIFVLAHSMGTRLLSDALTGLIDTDYQATSIKEIVLAAPDINTLEFRGYIEPKILERFKFRTTVYMSTNDFPLKISRILHEYPRLGDPTYERYIQKGVEVVDASSNSPVRRSWGHSYVWDNPLVTADFSKLINLGRGANSRGLRAVTDPSAVVYWVLD
jgi:esterase/lipase superfamily enzyme